MRRKGNVFFFPCHNSPDVQRGANQGTSSVFTELDTTTRQWKELCYLIGGEEPLGTLTLTGTWKESLSHSVLSPSAVVTTSYEPFTHRSHSIVKVDSGFAPVPCVMQLFESLDSNNEENTSSTVLTVERAFKRKILTCHNWMAAVTGFLASLTARCT